MVFEKITLVELRVEDAHIGGGIPDEDDDEMARESMEMESDSSERGSMGSRVRRLAFLGAFLGAVAAVGAVARRVRGRSEMDEDEHEIELEGEDDVELTA